MIYRDDAELARRTCAALERELATYRSFGATPALAAAAESAAARKAVDSLALSFGWLVAGIAGSLYLFARAAMPMLPWSAVFSGATFTLFHTASRARRLSHDLERRMVSLRFEGEELARSLRAREAGPPERRRALETSIAGIRADVTRRESTLAAAAARDRLLVRVNVAIAVVGAACVASFFVGVHLMGRLGGLGFGVFILGLFGSMACGVTGGVLRLRRGETRREHEALLDGVTLDRRRLALRLAELPFALPEDSP